MPLGSRRGSRAGTPPTGPGDNRSLRMPPPTGKASLNGSVKPADVAITLEPMPIEPDKKGLPVVEVGGVPQSGGGLMPTPAPPLAVAEKTPGYDDDVSVTFSKNRLHPLHAKSRPLEDKHRPLDDMPRPSYDRSRSFDQLSNRSRARTPKSMSRSSSKSPISVTSGIPIKKRSATLPPRLTPQMSASAHSVSKLPKQIPKSLKPSKSRLPASPAFLRAKQRPQKSPPVSPTSPDPATAPGAPQLAVPNKAPEMPGGVQLTRPPPPPVQVIMNLNLSTA